MRDATTPGATRPLVAVALAALLVALSGCTATVDPHADVQAAIDNAAANAGPHGALRLIDLYMDLTFGAASMQAQQAITLYDGDAFRMTLLEFAFTGDDGQTEGVDGSFWVQCTPEVIALELSGFGANESADAESTSLREDNPVGRCLGLDEADFEQLLAPLEDAVGEISFVTLLAQAAAAVEAPDVEVLEVRSDGSNSIAQVRMAQDGMAYTGEMVARDGRLRSLDLASDSQAGFGMGLRMDYTYGDRAPAPAL